MNILICAATENEIKPLLRHLEVISERKTFLEFRVNGHSIYPLITGIGSTMTAFAMARFTKISGIQIAINAGIAGSYSDDLEIGDTVEVVKDRFADLGAEDQDGGLLDVFDLGLQDPDVFPYKDGWIENRMRPYNPHLREADGLTVNKTSGTTLSIALIKDKYQADVETMEGAGFFMACKTMDIACTQIRTISNKVESRNTDNWQLQLAIERLNQELIGFLHSLTKEKYV